MEYNGTYDAFWESTLAGIRHGPKKDFHGPNVLVDDNYWGRYPIPFLHSTEMYDRIAPYVPIRFLHLYDPVPMRTNFLCRILPNTPRSCRASKEADERGSSEPLVLNSGAGRADWSWFDKLVLTALARGMFQTNRTRYNVVNKVMTEYEVVWNRTLLELPRKCPDQGALYSLWDHSWKGEKRMLGGKANLTLHIELFLRNIRNAKYCEIDASKTLQRKEWKDLFREISG